MDGGGVGCQQLCGNSQLWYGSWESHAAVAGSFSEMEARKLQENEPPVPLVFLCLTLFSQSHIFLLHQASQALHDSFITHQSRTTSSPSPTLAFYSHPLLFSLIRSQCQRQMVLIVLGLLVFSGGSGDGPQLACRPCALGPNDAGSGSAVWQAAGWDCGNHWESGGLWVFATAFLKKESVRINWNCFSISKEPSPFWSLFQAC